MGLTYDGITYRSLEEQVRYDAEQVQLLKQADVTINENLQTVNENLQTVNTEINGKLTKPTNPSAESAVTMLADGTVGTKPLSEIGGGKLYKHRISLIKNSIGAFILNVYRPTIDHIPLSKLKTYCDNMLAYYSSENTEDYIGNIYFNDATHISFNGTIIKPITEPPGWKTVNLTNIALSEFESAYEIVYHVTEM